VRHVRMLGLCLVAAFAVAAIASTSASALPEWGKCEAKAGGNYTDANCTVKAKPKGTGSFEWKKGAELKPVHFEGGNVGSGGVLYTKPRVCDGFVGIHGFESVRVPRKVCEEKGYENDKVETFNTAIECESEHNTGEATGKNEVKNVTVKFLGCKLFGSIPCSNGSNEGEIAVNQLKGTLGYINKAEKKVGVLLEPVVKKGEFAKFSCAGALANVVGVGNKTEGAEYTSSGCTGICPGTTPEEEKHGGYDGIISPITPVNQMTSEYTQVYTVKQGLGSEAPDENIPNKFEGKHIELLENYYYAIESPWEGDAWSSAGEEITNVNHPVEPGEIKA